MNKFILKPTAYLAKTWSGFLSLLKGMGLTMRYFRDPSTVVTQQYPENRDSLQMFSRFRGHLVLITNDQGQHQCVACGLCEKACPNGTISVHTTRDISGRKILGRYIYRLSQCTLCNLCVEACPYGAIEMGHNYELAVYDRDDLTQVLFEEKRHE